MGRTLSCWITKPLLTAHVVQYRGKERFLTRRTDVSGENSEGMLLDSIEPDGFFGRDKYHGITTPSYRRDRLECYLAWTNKYLMPKDAVARAQRCPVPLR